MSENKTGPTEQNAIHFLNSVEHKTRREAVFALLVMMEEVTGEEAVMWGTSIVGFGSYHYKYESGLEGTAARPVRFSPLADAPGIGCCVEKRARRKHE